MRMTMNENEIFRYNHAPFRIANAGLVNSFIYKFVNLNILLSCYANPSKIILRLFVYKGRINVIILCSYDWSFPLWSKFY